MAQGKQSFNNIKGSMRLLLQRRDTVARLGELTPEIVLLNSDDRSSGYQLHAGLFRFVCANGLMVADSLIASVRTHHMGGKEFKKRMLERADGQLGDHDCGQFRRQSAGGKAETIAEEELRLLGWEEGELSKRPKSAPCKPALAGRLREETTLTLKQIAARCNWAHPRARTPIFIGG
jgi:hypothetical protein